MPLTNQKKRAMAERMYIEDGKSAQYIVEFLVVSAQTISKWKKGRKGEKNWDERRAENLSAPHKIRSLLLSQLEMVAKGEKPTVDADALSKISRVLQDVSNKISTQVCISVLTELDLFISENYPEKVLEISKLHRAFILQKASLE